MDTEISLLLRTINPHTGATVAELSRVTGINKKRVRKIAERMVSFGYILSNNKITKVSL